MTETLYFVIHSTGFFLITLAFLNIFVVFKRHALRTNSLYGKVKKAWNRYALMFFLGTFGFILHIVLNFVSFLKIQAYPSLYIAVIFFAITASVSLFLGTLSIARTELFGGIK